MPTFQKADCASNDVKSVAASHGRDDVVNLSQRTCMLYVDIIANTKINAEPENAIHFIEKDNEAHPRALRRPDEACCKRHVYYLNQDLLLGMTARGWLLGYWIHVLGSACPERQSCWQHGRLQMQMCRKQHALISI